MTGTAFAEIGLQRLHRQRLVGSGVDTCTDTVTALLALQAQDYLGSLWAIGSRTQGATESSVERAAADARIVRTWPMRGTLHWLAAADVRWMLALLAPRAIARDAARLEREHGLDAKTVARARRIAGKALRDGAQLERGALYAHWDAAGIDTAGQRGLNLIVRLAQHGALCHGPRRGRQPTFVLLDHWVPPTPLPSRDAMLARLAQRYFHGHGPASVHDLATWSGLTVKDAQAAIALAGDALVDRASGERRLWSTATATDADDAASVLLLAPFDESLVGYRERAHVLAAEHAPRVVGRNGLIAAAIMVDGRIVGTWKRRRVRDAVQVVLEPFAPLPRTRHAGVRAAAKRYAAFLGCAQLQIDGL